MNSRNERPGGSHQHTVLRLLCVQNQMPLDVSVGLIGACNDPPEQGFKSGFIASFAFPNHEHTPTQCTQRFCLSQVSLYIAVELNAPEELVCRGIGCQVAARVSMPEAAVHEDGRSVHGQHNIGLSGQPLVMQTKTQANSMQVPPHAHFRHRIRRTDPRHHSGAGHGINNVSHEVWASRSRQLLKSAISAFGSNSVRMRQRMVQAVQHLPTSPSPHFVPRCNILSQYERVHQAAWSRFQLPGRLSRSETG